MRRKSNNLISFIAMLLLVCMLFGCSNVRIQEDKVKKEDKAKEDLPVLDPQAGVAKDVNVTLYYRLTNESYLVGVTRNISVRANERTEYAIIRTLLEGVPPLSSNVEKLFPADTSIVDVTLDNGILYITLSKEFLDTTEYDQTVLELTVQRQKGDAYLSREAYEDRMAKAEAELYLKRALGVYSLVNTLCEYSPDIRVHFLVDVNGTGAGVRLKKSELGINAGDDVDSDLIEPMSFASSKVATPIAIIDALLTHLLNYDEYEMAYVLFAESENEEQQKPSYANFETEILSIGKLSEYEIIKYSISADGNNTYVYVNLKLDCADGTKKSIKEARIIMKREGDIYKVGYDTFKNVLVGGA